MPDAPEAHASDFRLYNTRTRQVEPLKPAEQTAAGEGKPVPHLRFYACGPTVYTFAHIGNFRSFLTADLIQRTARALGWQVTYVSNVTDVGHLSEDDLTDPAGEDKMAQALEEEGRRFANVYDLARFYTEALVEDWRRLNLREPTVRPRATEHMAGQIKAVEKLVERGHAYETEQGVYFSVESFPGYGALSGNEEAQSLQASGRDTVTDPEKRDPRDFALWKKDPDHLMQWHSPWGWGFPGWHIECSVMGRAYLGETFDLHTGGEDLIFPHHECEVAQNESLRDNAGDESGGPSIRHWAHTRFLQVEGEKMSKSKGNFFTVRDLALPEDEGGEGIDPLALRLTLISGQYRKPFNFTRKTLRDSAQTVRRYREVRERAEKALEEDAGGGDDDRAGTQLDAIYDRTLAAMCDDLNTPAALAAAYEGVKLLRGIEEEMNGATARSAIDWLEKTNALLGIVGYDTGETDRAAKKEPGAADDAFAQQVEALLAERADARERGDYERADAIRDRLEDEMDVEVMDNPDGTDWRRKLSV